MKIEPINVSIIANQHERAKKFKKEESLKKFMDEVANSERMLNEAIDNAQSQCQDLTITDYDVIHAVRELDNFIHPKDKKNGVFAWINPNSQPLDKRNSNGIPESTQFDLIFKDGSWYLNRICRTLCARNPMYCAFTDEAKRQLIDRIENGEYLF